MHMQTHARMRIFFFFFFWANPQACMKDRCGHTHTHIGARILTHTLTCSSLHLFSCVLFFFLPAVVPPRRAAGKRSPRGGTGALIDSREFGGRRASKAALPLPLSSRPSALSAPSPGPARFHLQTPQGKISTRLSECTPARLSMKMLNC